VDQLESKTPGFVGQLKAPILTKNRYKVATIFVDHYSRLSFIYLQYSTSGAETIKAKQAFEDFAKSHGVTIRHYHADNGRFIDNLFKNSCEEKGQTQSFCGVNAHWQNGLAERHIRTHQEMARTMLLHAKQRWPAAIETYLWPYALRMASDVLRYVPRFDGKIPMTLFPTLISRLPNDTFIPSVVRSMFWTMKCNKGKVTARESGQSARVWVCILVLLHSMQGQFTLFLT
jgi:hypothetical protein